MALPEASVSGKIVAQGRAKKITVLKFKKGNQYKISRATARISTAVEVSERALDCNNGTSCRGTIHRAQRSAQN